MPWEIVIRDDRSEDADAPLVTVMPEGFLFNATFSRLAELDPGKRVTIYLDHENRKIAFEFHEDDRDNCYRLGRVGGAKARSRRGALQCWSQKPSKYPWVKRVCALPPKGRRFRPTREGKKWVIQLCPAFETRSKRNSPDIPADAVGIYRYVRSNGEVVYIGRGEIARRLASPERQNWEFEWIEYSIVANGDEQARWESYWLSRFREDQNGKLPIYNKIAGASVLE